MQYEVRDRRGRRISRPRAIAPGSEGCEVAGQISKPRQTRLQRGKLRKRKKRRNSPRIKSRVTKSLPLPTPHSPVDAAARAPSRFLFKSSFEPLVFISVCALFKFGFKPQPLFGIFYKSDYECGFISVSPIKNCTVGFPSSILFSISHCIIL